MQGRVRRDAVETKPIYGYSLTAELLGDCGGNFYRMSNVSKIAIPTSTPVYVDVKPPSGSD